MSTVEEEEGPINSINQVIFVINKVIGKVNDCLILLFEGTPNKLLGYDENGDIAEINPDRGLTQTGTDLDVTLAPFDTDELSEGSVNLYFTEERVDDRIDSLIQDGYRVNWTYDDGADTLTANFEEIFATINATPFSATNQSVLYVNPDVPGTDIVINLPSSTSRVSGSNAKPLLIKNIGTGNKVIVTPNGAEEIDGVNASVDIKKEVALWFNPDGSNWWIS
jgi:hypothetical protein